MARHPHAPTSTKNKRTDPRRDGAGPQGQVLGHAVLAGGEAGSRVGCADEGGCGGVERG